MTVHAHEDDADPDFEWVNAWAAAEAARSAPAGPPVDSPAGGAVHVGSPDVAPGVAGTPAAPSPEAIAPAPQDSDAAQAQSATVPLLETARRRKRWTHLFRTIARESETERPALSMLDAPREAPSEPAGRTQEANDGNNAEALDLAQIERDMAEIELVRDRLLCESTPAPRRTADCLASVRTSDCVPILVGGVLAFTSLVVFGAAAWFVSLR
jgi:hypothetical protein